MNFHREWNHYLVTLFNQRYYLDTFTASEASGACNQGPKRDKTMVFYLNDSMKRKVSITNPDKNETNGSRTEALLESFCRTTTAHGFQCYIRSESRICHYIWLVITITGFVAIGIHLSLVTAAYLR